MRDPMKGFVSAGSRGQACVTLRRIGRKVYMKGLSGASVGLRGLWSVIEDMAVDIRV